VIVFHDRAAKLARAICCSNSVGDCSEVTYTLGYETYGHIRTVFCWDWDASLANKITVINGITRVMETDPRKIHN